MSYKFIINPVDNKSYSIYSELGRELLKSYINQSGGSMEEDEVPEEEEYFETAEEDIPEEEVGEDKPEEEEYFEETDGDKVPEEDELDNVSNRMNLSLGGGGIDYEYIQNILKFII